MVRRCCLRDECSLKCLSEWRLAGESMLELMRLRAVPADNIFSPNLPVTPPASFFTSTCLSGSSLLLHD